MAKGKIIWTDLSGQPAQPHEERGPYLVYSHVCLANGKTYIGMTRQKELARWRNGKAYKKNKEFYADIEKYGWDNFIHRIEYRGMTEEEALVLESVLIELDGSCYPACGYNHAEYGTTGWQATEEQRAELSRKKKQYIAEHPEYIENLAAARRGKPRSEETKKKISGTLKGVPLTEEAKANMAAAALKRKGVTAVRCVETGVVYRSAREAHEDTGVNYDGIGHCCRGESKTSGGFHWEYAGGNAAGVMINR